MAVITQYVLCSDRPRCALDAAFHLKSHARVSHGGESRELLMPNKVKHCFQWEVWIDVYHSIEVCMISQSPKPRTRNI
jgi:hypothetical protein